MLGGSSTMTFTTGNLTARSGSGGSITGTRLLNAVILLLLLAILLKTRALVVMIKIPTPTLATCVSTWWSTRSSNREMLEDRTA